MIQLYDMKEKILNTINKHIQDYRIDGYFGRGTKECNLHARIGVDYIQLNHSESQFTMTIYRGGTVVFINGEGYNEEFNFIEMFIELEKINSIFFDYIDGTEETIKQEKIIYNRDKIINSLI